MTTTNSEETRAVYEISKLTSQTKQIMDDFTSSVVMTMFKDYISSFDESEVALNNFMISWEKNIIAQKEDELEVLTQQQDTMTNMVVGQKISEEEDLAKFRDNVDFVSTTIKEAIYSSLS